MQLKDDNITEFLYFIKGGQFVLDYTKDPKDVLKYAICNELGVNIRMGEYAVYVGENQDELSIFSEEDWEESITPPIVKELVKMLNILLPVVEEGIAVFNIIQDLTDNEISIKCLGDYNDIGCAERFNQYELNGHIFELNQVGAKVKSVMIL